MGAEPADHVQASLRLYHWCRRPGSAEGLLADDGAGTFVVDVEVAAGVAQSPLHLHDGLTVLGEHCAGERVGEAVSQMRRVSSSWLSS